MSHHRHERQVDRDEITSLSTERLCARFDNLAMIIEEKDRLLAMMQPYIVTLTERRHDEYELPESVFNRAVPIAEQFYEQPTYNSEFVHDTDKGGGVLNSRSGGREFHQADDYRHGRYTAAILEAAQALGYVAPELPPAPTDPIDQALGIADSYLQPIDEPAEAVIIPTARSISNPMRTRDALRNIDSGAVLTNKLIFASCDRPVDDVERAKMEQLGLHYGTTEFGSAVAAFNDFTHTAIDPEDAEPFFVELNGQLFEGKQLKTIVDRPRGPLEVIFVSAPFDPRRIVGKNKETGQPVYASRANSEENFLAAYEFLSPDPSLLVIESHDVWAKCQAEVAQQILGPKGKRTFGTGPFKLDRFKMDENGKLALNAPGEVVDEIAKTYAFATQTRLTAWNAQRRIARELARRTVE